MFARLKYLLLSNLISSRATSSDFLPVTLRFLPDQQETTGGDEVARGDIKLDKTLPLPLLLWLFPEYGFDE